MLNILSVVLLIGLSSATQEELTPDSALDPLCPFPSRGITYFPHPADCAKYLECYSGTKYVMSCPPNLFWHQEISRCDYPENVDCRPRTTSSHRTSTTESHHQRTSTTESPTSDTTSKPNPPAHCPNSEGRTLYPHPSDCRKFIECDTGVRKEMKCPDGLYWNQEAEWCDWRSNVNCPSHSTDSDRTSTTHHHLSSTSEPPTSGTTSKPSPAGRCPKSKGLIFYPDPSDCRKFIECYDGVRREMKCPKGLYWNQEAEWCDWLSNVNCNSYSTSARSTATTRAPTRSTTARHSARDPMCPYPSHDSTYFPYPGDCAKFWECYAGVRFAKKCPAGLYWNEDISECDYPGNVDCK